jgi:beta-mannosidase
MALQLVPLWLLLMPAAFTANAVVVDIPLSSDGGIANWTLSSAPAGAADQHISTVSVPALVPGDVNDDLERSGHLPDLWVADNSVDVPWWVPIRTWTYTAEFPTPSSAQHTSTTLAAVDLRFEGVDYNATFVLNGKTLGSHMGSFLPIVYDVAALLRAGSERNVLTVIIHPPTDLTLISALYNGSTPMYGLDHCKQRREMPWWKSVLNQWDFACKYYQIGIWRGVSLHIGAPGSRGSGAKLQTLPTVLPHLAPPYTTATLELRGAVLLDPLHLGKQLRLQWSVECLTDPGAPNASVYSTAIGSAPTTAVNASVQLRSPRLWWPNGYGKQNRYRLTLTLLDSDANILDSTGALFGVRHLQNLENEHDKSWLYNRYGDGGCGPCLWNSSTYPECNRTDGGHRALTCSAEEAGKYPSPSRWLFAINGRRVFARGGNWVPGDLAFGRLVRQKRRFRALLSMARALGYTYIRIWGGGLLEDSQFYDYADEFGIMLQQDFPLAGCGFSPNKTTGSWAWLNESIPRAGGVSVLGAFEEQLPIALRQLMNHPSIVRYTLGNELYLNRTQVSVRKKTTAACVCSAAERCHCSDCSQSIHLDIVSPAPDITLVVAAVSSGTGV